MRPTKRVLLLKLLALRVFQKSNDKIARRPSRAADLEAVFRDRGDGARAPPPDLLTGGGGGGDDAPRTPRRGGAPSPFLPSPAREEQVVPRLSNRDAAPAPGERASPRSASSSDDSALSLLTPDRGLLS